MRAARLVGAAWLLAAAGAFAQEADAPAKPAADDPEPRVDTSSYAARGASDEIVLERTEVTGNRELPKVLYIVPWQQSDPGALAGRPVNTLLDEVLALLDREEFLRQVDYYSDLYGDAAGAQGDAPEEAPVAGRSAASD
jgi:hypothetical protein